MRSFIKIFLGLWVVASAIFKFAGPVQSADEIASGWPTIKATMTSIIGNPWVPLVLLLAIIVYKAIERHLHPVQITILNTDSPHRSISALIVNHDKQHTKRVMWVKLRAFAHSGKPTEIPPIKFDRCAGFKDGRSHVMEADSSFEVGYMPSVGSMHDVNALCEIPKRVTYFYVVAKLENGSEIKSKRLRIRLPKRDGKKPDGNTEPAITVPRTEDKTAAVSMGNFERGVREVAAILQKEGQNPKNHSHRVSYDETTRIIEIFKDAPKVKVIITTISPKLGKEYEDCEVACWLSVAFQKAGVITSMSIWQTLGDVPDGATIWWKKSPSNNEMAARIIKAAQMKGLNPREVDRPVTKDCEIELMIGRNPYAALVNS